MIQLNKLIKSYIFYMISAFGISLTIKAAVGVSSFNSMNLAFSSAFNIKVGTITMGINAIFLMVYMYLTQFKLKGKYFIQLVSVILFGTFINFFTYTLLGGLVINTYPLRVFTVGLGTIIGGFAVGMIVSFNTITFPIESVCLYLSEKSRFSFTQLRYGVDVFSVTVSIAVSLLYTLPLYVREGTIISLMLFSYTMGSVKKWHGNRLEKRQTQTV